MRVVAEIAGKREEFPIAKRKFAIGRSTSCEVTILSATVSRRHVECEVLPGREDRLRLRDLGTRNGTFVDDQRVTEAEVGLGQSVRAGSVPLQFLAGGPPLEEAVGEEIAAVVAADLAATPELPMARDLAGGDEPTPLDQAFAPDAALPARVMHDAMRAGLPATATVLESRPQKAFRLSRRFWIMLGALVVVVAAIIIAVSVLSKKPQTPVLSQADYNKHIEGALNLYRKDDYAACVNLLRKLRATPVKGNLKTAEIMGEAVVLDHGLAAVDGFAKNWERAEDRWKELRDYGFSPPSVKKLADERAAWISGESRNMYAYSEFAELMKKQEWPAALQKADSIPADSLFRKGVDEKVKEARTKYAKTVMDQADQALAGREWQNALALYQTLAKILGGSTAPLDTKMRAAHEGEREAGAISRANELVAAGRHSEAADALATVRPDGPYATELKQLSRRLALTKSEAAARAAYDAGKGEDGLKVLEQAGEANSDLYKRITAVLQSWNAAQESMKTADFAKAQADCRNILAVENSVPNYYRREAQKLLASWKEEATRMAQAMVAQGQQAGQERKYAEARKLFEQARRVDPDGKAGTDQIREMKREAVIEYNRALNLREKNVADALIVFREVKARLQADDPYYNEADVWIKKLTKAP